MRCLIAFVLLISVISQPAFSRTWYIEKDGTGDFASLQPAADAASSGDTLRIGPGRFDEISTTSCSSYPYPLRLVLQKASLTIIGAGEGQTIIGPEEISPFWQAGIFGNSHCGNRELFISNVRFENLGNCIDSLYGVGITVDSCSFINCRRGLVSNQTRTLVTNCLVNSDENNSRFLAVASGGPVYSLIVNNCLFDTPNASGSQILGGAEHIFEISNCIFTSTGTGVGYSGHGGRIINSTFSGQASGITINTGQLTIDNCTFSNVTNGIKHIDWFGNGELNILDCVFSNVGGTSLRTYGLKSGYLRNSVLDRGEQYVVQVNLPYTEMEFQKQEPELIHHLEHENLHYYTSVYASIEKGSDPLLSGEYHFDMTNNWWGTTDPDSIQAWIFDGHDLENWPVFVDWDPYKSDSVGQESKSLGGFKSMFR